MSVDPDLRIALGFILLLRLGIGIFYSNMLAARGILAELRQLTGSRSWRIVLAFLTIPLILFVVDVDGLALVFSKVNSTIAEYSIMWFPDLFRWLLLIPAMAGLLLAIWSRQCAVTPSVLNANELRNHFVAGPFRFVRFPQALADLLLFGPLLVATDNWGAVLSFFTACLILCGMYVPRAEESWRRLLGDGYGAYADRTGAILPRVPNRQVGMTQQYSVPKRFGISAIISLVTMFAVIFGCINLLQAQISEFQLSPMLHLFFGVELMAIWIGQMRFGKSPRSISTLVGAILLPLFAFFTIDLAPSSLRTLVMMALFFFGGLIGYCLGALAAGLFLILDWIGPHLPGSRGPRFAANSAAASVSWPSSKCLSPHDERNPNDE